MKAKKLLILMSLFLFIHGCVQTKTAKMAPVTRSSNQKVAYDGTITSQKRHFVSLSPYTELNSAIVNFDLSKYKTIFMLALQNCGKEPIDIGLDNISVVFEAVGKESASNDISLQPYNDFIKDFEEEYKDNEKNYIYNTLYRIWNLSKLGGISPERATDMCEDIKYNLTAMRRQNEVFQEMFPKLVIKQETIMPGNTYNAMVVCDTHSLGPNVYGSFKILVAVDGEEHKFIFKRE